MAQPMALPRFNDLNAFDDWACRQDGKWELHDGEPVLMAPERVGHARIKTRIWQELVRAVRDAGLPCEAFVDGPLVPGPGLRRFQPDVVLTCGDRPDDDSILVEAPVIVVEVVSPSSEYYDSGIKLESYFALPSVRHYLIVYMNQRLVIHHARHDGPGLMTSLHRDGNIELHPPGISLPIAATYAGSNLDVAT